MATNAVYKIYTGSGWVEYYFKTSAAQVGESTSRVFITKDSSSSNNNSTKINNKDFTISNVGTSSAPKYQATLTLYGTDIAISSSNSTKIDAAIDAKIAKSILAAKGDILYASAANTPANLAIGTAGYFLKANSSGVPEWAEITKTTVGLSNVENTKLSTWAGSSNLTTCSQGTFGTAATANKATETSAADLKTSTGLITGAQANTIINSYSPNNMVTASANITDGNIVVGDGGAKGVKDSGTSLSSLVAIVNGKNSAMVTYAYKSDNKYYILAGNSANPTLTNGKYVPSANGPVYAIEITANTQAFNVTTTGTSSGTVLQYIYVIVDEDGTAALTGTTKYDTFNRTVGDPLYIKQTNLPDFWATSTFTLVGQVFSVLETDKVALDDYVTLTGSQTVSNKTFTSCTYNGYTLGASCAKGVETSLTNTDNNVPTSAAVKSFVEGKGYTTNTGTVTSITIKTGTGLTGGSATAVSTSGTWTIGIDSSYKLPTTTEWGTVVLNTTTVNGHALSSNVTVTRSDVDANKIYYGPSSGAGAITPTGMISGDVWIDTSN